MPDQFTQTFNGSVLFIFISVKLTVVNPGAAVCVWWWWGGRRGSKGSWRGLKLKKKKTICRQKRFHPLLQRGEVRKSRRNMRWRHAGVRGQWEEQGKISHGPNSGA